MSTSFSAVTARVCAATGKTVIKAAHSGAAAARPQLSAAIKLPSTKTLPVHRFLKSSSQPAQPAAAAICTMGARGGRLRESLELRVRAESGSTLMVDSSTAVRLSPATPAGTCVEMCDPGHLYCTYVACQPPACCAYQRRRAACPRGLTHRTYAAARVPASGVPYVLRAVAPQAGTEYGIGIHAGIESGALLVITPDAHVPCREAHTGLWARYDLSPSASLVSVQLADLHAQAASLYTCVEP